MRERLITLVVFALILIVVNTIQPFVYAQTPTETPTPSQTTPTPTSEAENKDKSNNLQKEINELQGKITDLQKQQKTLSSQIAVMDNQTKLTELKIASTKEQIEELGADIETATKKIGKLESSLSDLTKVLLNRIVATYKIKSVSPLDVLVTSDSATDILKKSNYLEIVQENDKKLIYATQEAKNDYANQKEIYEEKKNKVEALKQQLEDYTAQLEQEKKDKENLLAVTKNSESEYQKRLNDALKELRQIQKAAQVLVSTAPRHVARGEVIGLMGSTGYSFGAHLHFGVYGISKLEDYNYYSGYEDPKNFLESQSVDWNTGCSSDPSGSSNTGSGSFAWPMSTSGLHISQNFGHTCYSSVYYRGNPHPALDMYNNGDITIRAVEEGEAYTCRNCTGDGANGVFLFHPNGKMTLYWHLQ